MVYPRAGIRRRVGAWRAGARSCRTSTSATGSVRGRGAAAVRPPRPAEDTPTQAQKDADAAKARERRAAKKTPETAVVDPFGDVPREKRGGMALYD